MAPGIDNVQPPAGPPPSHDALPSYASASNGESSAGLFNIQSAR